MNKLSPDEKKLHDLIGSASNEPPAALWENIVGELEKKERRLFPFYLLFLLIIPTAYFIYVGIMNNCTDNPVNSESINAQSTTNNTTSISDDENDLNQPKNKGTSVVNHSGSKYDIENSSFNVQDIMNKEPNFIDNNIGKRAGNDNNIEKGYIGNNGLSTDQSSGGLNTSNDLLSSTVRVKIKSHAQFSDAEVSKVDAENHPYPIPGGISTTKKGFSKLNYLPGLSLGVFRNDKMRNVINVINIQGCELFPNRNRTRIFFDLGLLGAYPLLKLTSSPDQNPWLDLRQDSEKSWYGWGATLAGGILLKRHWLVSTGIHFTQVKERFELLRPGIVRTTVIQYPDGRKPDTLVTKGTEINKGEIRQSFTSIPLILGYLTRTDQWMWSVEGGPIMNILFSAEGKMLQADKTPALRQDTPLFKRRIGLGVTGSVNLYRYIMDDVSVFIRPSLTWYAGNINTNQNPVKQQYIIPGINFGTRIFF